MSTTNNQQFFSTTKRGEISEWKENLESDKEATRKDAVKKIIAAMTVGKDVSMLFPDVIKSIQTQNIELKKLVYLYIMNYAKSNPDLAMLAVNTFVNDSKHSNPLVRALSVRTMGCIRVNKIIDYLAEPLQRTLQDKDPYVRKTAAVAVAKLYDLNPEMTIDKGFIQDLEKLLYDPNPMVISNAVASLSEIMESSKDKIIEFNQKTVSTLLTALNDCTEWGQIFILDSLVHYEVSSEKEAIQNIERIIPRLQHANSGVVLSAIKIIMKMLNKVKDEELIKTFSNKLSGPLVTLLNSKPEIQYVALRNISLIVQKRPMILSKDFKIFFCKYNDPIYVKLEKLDILIKLASERNIEQILLEFQEYSSEVDVQFVRKSVRAIGRCAIKLERASQRCIDVLLELIKTKINYVVQEAIIVIKDIFRKYPNKYEGIIGVLCENLDTLDEPEAKASMIWIIGEYAERIENADELLEVFIDSFHDESTQVQLQLLTSCVKLYLKKGEIGDKLVKNVITLATKESDNPDLRDRGFVYYRLLSLDANVAKSIVLSEKEILNDESHLSTSLLNELLLQISTLSSIYHKPPELFVPDYNKKLNVEEEEDIIEKQEQIQVIKDEVKNDQTIGNLLDFDIITPPKKESLKESFEIIKKPDLKMLLNNQNGKGLQIEGSFDQLNLNLRFTNTTNNVFTGFAIKFNKNTFGINSNPKINITSLLPSSSQDVVIPLILNGAISDKYSNMIQMALKTDQTGILYFQDSIPLSSLFITDKISKEEYIVLWKSITQEHQIKLDIHLSLDEIISRMEWNKMLMIAKVPSNDKISLFFFSKMKINEDSILILSEIRNDMVMSTRTAYGSFVSLYESEVMRILQ